MAKSTIEQIITAIRTVNTLDRRGRLAVLRNLQKEELEEGKAKPKKVPTYEEGMEQ